MTSAGNSGIIALVLNKGAGAGTAVEAAIAANAAGLAAASRESLAGGTLAIYIVNAGGRRHPLRLIRLAWHIVLGTALDGDHLELMRTTAATVEARVKIVHMALDGEVETFYAPLQFRILPGVLRVLVPAQDPGR
jgi:diacylglycerol kinase family enzyme